jgi:hypothetical protein
MKNNQLLILTVALAVTAVLGFIAGRTTVKQQEATNSTNGKMSDTRDTTRSVRRSAASSKRGVSPNRSQDVRLIMKTLINRLEGSSMPSMEFEGVFEIWEIARNFSEDELRVALAQVGEIQNSKLRMSLQTMLMNRWGKLNGQAAMEHVIAMENNKSRMASAMGTLMSWIKTNPEAVFLWYENNKEKMGGGRFRNVYDGIIYRTMARHDLSRAMNQVKKIDNRQSKQIALVGIARSIAGEPEKLNSFIQLLDDENDPEMKKEVMSSAMLQMAMTAPEDAKKHIQNISDPEEQKEMVHKLVQRLSYSDPKTALTWGLEQSKDEAAQSDIVNKTLGSWAIQDPKKSGEWYDKQPDHLKSDEAISKASSMLSELGRYKDAFAWMQRGTDSEIMDMKKRHTYQKWLKYSPEKAKAWLGGEGAKIMQGIDINSETDSTGKNPVSLMERALEIQAKARALEARDKANNTSR